MRRRTSREHDFSTAVDARAATDLLVFDDAGGRDRIAGCRIRSAPLPFRDDIERPYRHVEIDIAGNLGSSSTLSEALRRPNEGNRWQVKHPSLELTHDAYIWPLIEWLFGCLEPQGGTPHLNAELRSQIQDITARVFGDPGTAWKLDAAVLFDAIVATGDVLDLTAPRASSPVSAPSASPIHAGGHREPTSVRQATGSSDRWVTELVNVANQRVLVWSAHRNKLGATRMLASLAKPWANRTVTSNNAGHGRPHPSTTATRSS